MARRVATVLFAFWILQSVTPLFGLTVDGPACCLKCTHKSCPVKPKIKQSTVSCPMHEKKIAQVPADCEMRSRGCGHTKPVLIHFYDGLIINTDTRTPVYFSPMVTTSESRPSLSFNERNTPPPRLSI